MELDEKEKMDILFFAMYVKEIDRDHVNRLGISAYALACLVEDGLLEYDRLFDYWELTGDGENVVDDYFDFCFKKQKKEVRLATMSFKNSSAGLGWLDAIMPLDASVDAKETQIDAKKIWRRRS